MKALFWLCMILVIIGALNWGLVGLFNFNFIAYIFGSMTFLTRIVYIVVGVSAIVLIYAKTKIK